MPSVLIELDFICNPIMEKYLDSDKGKQAMAQSISDAFSSYLGAGSAHMPKATSDKTKKPSKATVESKIKKRGRLNHKPTHLPLRKHIMYRSLHPQNL